MRKYAGMIVIIVAVVALALTYYFIMAKKNPQPAQPAPAATTSEQLSPSDALPANGLTLTSPAFKDGGFIPQEYTCEGEAAQPELHISGVDPAARALLLWVHDPDAPMPGGYDHWILYDLATTTTVISIGYMKDADDPGKDYVAPCPPSGTHRYIFKLFSLRQPIAPSDPLNWNEVEVEILQTALQGTKLTGLYKKLLN